MNLLQLLEATEAKKDVNYVFTVVRPENIKAAHKALKDANIQYISAGEESGWFEFKDKELFQRAENVVKRVLTRREPDWTENGYEEPTGFGYAHRNGKPYRNPREIDRSAAPAPAPAAPPSPKSLFELLIEGGAELIQTPGIYTFDKNVKYRIYKKGEGVFRPHFLSKLHADDDETDFRDGYFHGDFEQDVLSNPKEWCIFKSLHPMLIEKKFRFNRADMRSLSTASEGIIMYKTDNDLVVLVHRKRKRN